MNTFERNGQAFAQGTKAALRAPVWVLCASMLGFGAVGHTHEVSLLWLVLSTLLIFALPGQLLLMEMMLGGASSLSTGLAVTLSSSRFVTMAVTLLPRLDRAHHTSRLYAWVHLMAMTSWAVCMNRFDRIEPRWRLPFFLGFALPCFVLSVPATWAGHALAEQLPMPLTLALVMLNPLFFLLSFASARPLSNRLAVVMGLALGPFFYLWDSSSSLLLTGLVGGSLAFALSAALKRRRTPSEGQIRE
jgi:predicted branched-subunit amino acid permease